MTDLTEEQQIQNLQSDRLIKHKRINVLNASMREALKTLDYGTHQELFIECDILRAKITEIDETTKKLEQVIRHRLRSSFNVSLYNEIVAIMDDIADRKTYKSHYGKFEIGAVIDHLEQNYTLTKKIPDVQ